MKDLIPEHNEDLFVSDTIDFELEAVVEPISYVVLDESNMVISMLSEKEYIDNKDYYDNERILIKPGNEDLEFLRDPGVFYYNFDTSKVEDAKERLAELKELKELTKRAQEQLLYDKTYELATPKQKLALAREKRQQERRQALLEKRKEG